ncbi:MAG: barstar family protein [Campylobacter sp.]|uniref:barstar family protein n=1 Tax=Campylobacter sp. TaxID=205 RepID=UPI003FA17F99
MKIITLNGAKMREKTALFEYLARKFCLDPEIKNLDALYDALGEINEPTQIKLKNRSSLAALGGYADDLIAVFTDLAEENERVKFEILS